MKNLWLLDIDLNQFSEGEGSAPAPADGGQGSIESVADSTSDELIIDDGSEAPETPETEKAVSDEPEDFESLIKSKYKKDFDSRVQGIINQRFKETKTMEKELSEMKDLVSILQHKYGTEDVKSLHERLESEIIEDLAYENDMTPENYRKIMEADKIKKQSELMESERQRQEQINLTIQKWETQAQELRQNEEYKDFNLREAMQNDQFLDMIKSNVPVKAAWEIVNLDKMKEEIRKGVETRTVQNIQAKKQRPAEAASKGSTGAVVRNDVKSLTKEKREEIAKRAQRGEKISFG